MPFFVAPDRGREYMHPVTGTPAKTALEFEAVLNGRRRFCEIPGQLFMENYILWLFGNKLGNNCTENEIEYRLLSVPLNVKG